MDIKCCKILRHHQPQKVTAIEADGMVVKTGVKKIQFL